MSWNVIEEDAKKVLLKACEKIKASVKADEITLSEPPSLELGDVSSNLPFILAKQLKKKPQDIASELKNAVDLKGTYFEKSATAGVGYINLYLNYDKAKDLLKNAISEPEKYGTSTIGKNKKVLIEYSSPNIAKPMSIGHFRATILGDSLYRVLKSQGYNAVSDNHLGDFGTQFGKLIIAIEKWGDKKSIAKNPINELLKLYVKFHDEAEKNPALEDQARQKTKELEDDIINERKNTELYKTWALAEKLSLQEFEKTYKQLDIHFDLTLGEAFFAPMMKKAIKEVTAKGITETQEDGSVILNLKPHGLPNTILLRKDGGSVYITRDIPCFIYRSKKLKCDKIVYVIGKEQNLQFQQLFKTMELIGYKTQAEHVSFGHFRLAEGKMSTRKGTAIKIDDLINDVIEKAKEVINEKKPDVKNKNKLAETIGIGALKFSVLQQSKQKDVVFDKDKMLSFEGDTGPYVQYSHVRCNSILNKTKEKPALKARVQNDSEKQLIKTILKFPEVVTQSAKQYEVHLIAQYALHLTQDFNSFYRDSPVLTAQSPALLKQRLAFVTATKNTLKNALNLLGMRAPEKM